jgi:hypothetical protein
MPSLDKLQFTLKIINEFSTAMWRKSQLIQYEVLACMHLYRKCVVQSTGLLHVAMKCAIKCNIL